MSTFTHQRPPGFIVVPCGSKPLCIAAAHITSFTPYGDDPSKTTIWTTDTDGLGTQVAMPFDAVASMVAKAMHEHLRTFNPERAR